MRVIEQNANKQYKSNSVNCDMIKLKMDHDHSIHTIEGILSGVVNSYILKCFSNANK